jgi:hypothetical protein
VVVVAVVVVLAVADVAVVVLAVVDVAVAVLAVEVVVRLIVDNAGAMTDVASEVATVEPFLFVAVTTMRKVNLTSAAATGCCCPVAAMIGAQDEPVLSQRTHWKS